MSNHITKNSSSGFPLDAGHQSETDASSASGDTQAPPIPRDETSSVAASLAIPQDINDYDKHRAAKFYFEELGWAVQPLYAPDKGTELEKGKKPLLKGWKSHTTAEIEPEFFDKYFSPASTNNIGCVVRAPFVVVDLDSKPDKGASVRAWLEGQSDLATVPRERTGGGAHLFFICHDIPEEVLQAGEALAIDINDKVQAELFSNGLNIVLSPSIHKWGHQYHWEVTGEIQAVKWADLCRWFGFQTPEKKRGPGRPRKDPPWWGNYPEDLTTLNLTAALEGIGIPVKEADKQKAMFAIRCPWSEEHSTPPSSVPGTDTVVFTPAGKVPSFNCKHAHCADRSFEHLVEWMEQAQPGIIAKFTERLREWTLGETAQDGRPQIQLPGAHRPESEFAQELGEEIAASVGMFLRGEDVVEISTDSTDELVGTHFEVLAANSFVTAIEAHVQVGHLSGDDAGARVFVPQSISEKAGRIALASKFFRKPLPRIRRILDGPVPMLCADGEIVYPKTGFDPGFETWLDPGAPKLERLEFEEAVDILDEVLAGPERGGFWWKDNQSRAHALARLVTPFVRGLMDWQKCPVWIINGNVSGVGKDTFASLVHVVYTGRESTGAPLDKQSDDELRKRITSLLRGGARFIHLANLKGHIDFPSLEAATDNSGVWEDRVLGQSHARKFRNEAEYSLSANNASWTPDLERRSRHISLHCPLEVPGSHQFRHPDVLRMIRQNRPLILSALAALVRRWDEQGRPDSPSPFPSFPMWGRVVGGILESCGFPDPCLLQKQGPTGGDAQTVAMTQFFRLAFEEFGNQSFLKKRFLDFVRKHEETHELFDDVEFSTRSGMSKFSKLVLSFQARVLGGVVLNYTSASKNSGSYRFAQVAEKADAYPETGSEVGCEGREGSFPTDGYPTKNNSLADDANPTFNRLSFSRGQDVPDIPTSPPPTEAVFCKSADSIRRMTADLNGSSTITACLIPASGGTSNKQPINIDEVYRVCIRASPAGTVWVIDTRDANLKPNVAMALRIFLSLSRKALVTHDGKNLLAWLSKKFDVNAEQVVCLGTAARLIANGTDDSCDLDTCLSTYCPPDSSTNSRPVKLSLASGPDPLARKVDERVLRLHDLHEALKKAIADADLEDVWDLENRLLPVVATMEQNGMPADQDLLESGKERGNKEVAALLPYLEEDDRIRTTFDPLGQRTGRFSCTNPCLHNVSKGRARSVFRPIRGRILVSADYSQHDIRVLAAVTHDKALIDAFARDEDYHRVMAATLLGKTPDVITDEERNLAKAYSIGIVNGQQPKGIARTGLEKFGVNITDPDVKLRAFLDAHPAYEAFTKVCAKGARSKCEETRTRLGRRRIIPDEIDDGKRKRILLNTPIQGGAADAFKEAMILVHNRLPFGAKLVHCIHDELIVECEADQADSVSKILDRSMVEAMNMLYPEVKAKVDVIVGTFWGEKSQFDTSPQS